MKSMKAKVHQQVMKAMKLVKGKGKKTVKKDAIGKKKPIWKPSSDTIVVCPKSFYKGWHAYHGQVKMLKSDLEQAWYEHRDYRGYNKSYRCGTEGFKSFFGSLL